MKLSKGDTIKYDDSNYNVVAVIMGTVYLQKVDNGNGGYKFTMEQVYETYRDIEILKYYKDGGIEYEKQ